MSSKAMTIADKTLLVTGGNRGLGQSLVVMPGYSISKAAALSLTQSVRALSGGHGVTVHAVLAGPIDTDMSRELDVPKTAPESVASAIFDGVEAGEEDIFPDRMSKTLAESWRTGALKQRERQNAALVEAQTLAA